MIFEPFAQASNNQLREVQGTGIGLSLVKSFSELHGGYVDSIGYIPCYGICHKYKYGRT